MGSSYNPPVTSFIHPPGTPGVASGFVNSVLDGTNAGLMLHDQWRPQNEDSGWYLACTFSRGLDLRAVSVGSTVDGLQAYSAAGTNYFAGKFDASTDLGTDSFRWKSVKASGAIKGVLTTSANATTGLGAGLLAATTNATIVITDGTGQVYRVPCII